MKKSIAVALTMGVLAALAEPVQLLGPNAMKELCARRPQNFVELEATTLAPGGVKMIANEAMNPVWRLESSVPTVAPVKAGDFLVLTVATRGVAKNGKPQVLAKFQGADFVGLIRQDVPAAADWQYKRYTGVAKKDAAAGELRLHLYPAYDCQTVEFRDLRLEDWGPVEKPALPELAKAPTFGGEALTLPKGVPPPKPVVLAPLTAAEKAKPRYVMLKIDDVGNHKGGIHPGFARIAKYLAEKKLKSGFGVIVKSIEATPNADYIKWIKANALENGGYIEFWDHGWDHAMFFQCKEMDDDCDRNEKFHGEHATGYIHQKRHLAKAIDTFKKYTGITMHSIGTAGNACNANTAKVLRECPEMKVWIFGDALGKDKWDSGKTVLGRWLNLEYTVGKVDYQQFLRAYQPFRTSKDYVVLQGHGAMWTNEMFEDFKKIVETLEADGWIFTTPTEYAEKYSKK